MVVGNIACYGPLQAERTNVVIDLFVVYKDDFSSHNGCFGTPSNPTLFFSRNVLHISVTLLSRITSSFDSQNGSLWC